MAYNIKQCVVGNTGATECYKWNEETEKNQTTNKYKKSKQNVFSNGPLTKRTLWLLQNENMVERIDKKKTMAKERTAKCH